MIYSCFDARRAIYRYFADDRAHAVNADLPVPTLPATVNTIGVPAIEAPRSLPADAKPAGEGWHARGIVVGCQNVPVVGLGALDGRQGALVALAAIGALLLLISDPMKWRA